MSALSEPGTREALGADAERRCRAGMGAAAGALYAGAPSATAAALRDRLEAGASLWPWLPGLCFRALEPLRVAFPDDDRAMAVAGKALVGRPVRAARLAEAARQLRGERQAAGDPPDAELAAVIERFWQQLARLAHHLGEVVRAQDEDRVQRALQQAPPRLRKSAGTVRRAAERALTPPAPPPVAADDTRSWPAGPPPAPTPSGGGVSPAAGGAVSPGPGRALPATPGEPGEPLETRPAARGDDGDSPPAAHPGQAGGWLAGLDPGPQPGPPSDPAPGDREPPDAAPGDPDARAATHVTPERVPVVVEEEAGVLEPDRPYAPLIYVGGALALAMILLAAVAAGVIDL